MRSLPNRTDSIGFVESRGSAQAILLDTQGRLFLQLRDNVPHILNPGKISLFGGAREGTESFLDCIVREVQEEIGYYLPPERFEPIFRRFGNADQKVLFTTNSSLRATCPPKS